MSCSTTFIELEAAQVAAMAQSKLDWIESYREGLFRSTKHPHLSMNKYGVVFAPNGHPDGADYFGKSFARVWLRRGLLALMYEVQAEAQAAGFRKEYLHDGEVLFSRDSKILPILPLPAHQG